MPALIEGAGIGAGVASVLGAVLVGVMMIERKGAWELAVGVPVLGMVVGLVWGLIKRPTELGVAAEADRQLHLDDLLGTALLVLRGDTSDGWSQNVVALADSACARLSPGTLLMNRLGARTWGGIGVSAALLMTLGVMSLLPSRSEAWNETNGGVERVSLTPGSREPRKDVRWRRNGPRS